MMKSKFEYMLMGVAITLLSFFGIFTFVFTQAQAKEEQISDSNTTTIEKNLNDTPNVSQINPPNIEVSSQPLDDEVQTQVTPQIEVAKPVWVESNDLEVVLEMLRQLNNEQANGLLGQEGWIHISVTGPQLHESSEVSVDDYHGPDGQIVPGEALHPLGTTVSSYWYYVNQSGLVEKGLTFSADANNNIYQQTILQGDEWANVTLKTHDFPDDIYMFPAESKQLNSYLPTQEVIRFLEVAQMVDERLGKTEVISYKENGRFHLIVHSSFATPVELGSPIPESVTAGERHFVFDGINGNLLSDTHQFTLQSGETFLAGIAEYHTSPLFPQLPDDVQRLFDENQQFITEK